MGSSRTAGHILQGLSGLLQGLVGGKIFANRRDQRQSELDSLQRYREEQLALQKDAGARADVNTLLNLFNSRKKSGRSSDPISALDELGLLKEGMGLPGFAETILGGKPVDPKAYSTQVGESMTGEGSELATMQGKIDVLLQRAAELQAELDKPGLSLDKKQKERELSRVMSELNSYEEAVVEQHGAIGKAKTSAANYAHLLGLLSQPQQQMGAPQGPVGPQPQGPPPPAGYQNPIDTIGAQGYQSGTQMPEGDEALMVDRDYAGTILSAFLQSLAARAAGDPGRYMGSLGLVNHLFGDEMPQDLQYTMQGQGIMGVPPMTAPQGPQRLPAPY